MEKATLRRVLDATRGTKTGAIIRAAYGLERDAVPRFVGKGCTTSDHFVMANFIDKDGIGHFGAFVGAHADYDRNIKGVAEHCGLTPAERAMFFNTMDEWCGVTTRSTRKVL